MFFFLLTNNIITNDRQLERMKIWPVGSLSNSISGTAANAAAAALSTSSD